MRHGVICKWSIWLQIIPICEQTDLGRPAGRLKGIGLRLSTTPIRFGRQWVLPQRKCPLHQPAHAQLPEKNQPLWILPFHAKLEVNCDADNEQQAPQISTTAVSLSSSSGGVLGSGDIVYFLFKL